jgi:hypothetical protein
VVFEKDSQLQNRIRESQDARGVEWILSQTLSQWFQEASRDALQYFEKNIFSENVATAATSTSAAASGFQDIKDKIQIEIQNRASEILKKHHDLLHQYFTQHLMPQIEKVIDARAVTSFQAFEQEITSLFHELTKDLSFDSSSSTATSRELEQFQMEWSRVFLPQVWSVKSVASLETTTRRKISCI